METLVRTLEAFTTAAGTFAAGLSPKPEGATLVTLSGELGAGKTAFVKAAAKALGISEDVTSPTFVLLKSYELPRKSEDGFARLIHIDAYRLEGGVELAPLHFDEYLAQADNLIMLEWPEKVSDALPVPAVRVGVEAMPDGARKITYE